MADDLNAIFFGFIGHMRARHFAKTTMTGYCRYIRQFICWLRAHDITDVSHITGHTLRTYQASLMELKETGLNALSTVSLKFRAVRRLFEFLEDSGRIPINPAADIKEPNKEARLPKTVLSVKEARRILGAPCLSSKAGIRDRLIIELLYSTGMRLAEMLNLTVYDCDLEDGFLRVRGKYSKERIIPLGKHAVKFLEEYITGIRPHHIKGNPMRALFISQRGTPLAPQTVRHMVARYAEKAGIGRKVTPHVFRHTFATHLIRKGADITAVKNILGHSRLSVTHVYTKVAGTDVKKTHGDRHPREKDALIGEMNPVIRGFYHAKPD